ncbi:hypothetical protein GJV26_29510 [Massilia dura]|uniref:Uncharacterized protein n=3 Tax=Pseudoduganella dura TaxID=321982 RepID=A0A6I3XI95_9BURK|nr:hypothetical protein [Pseudoduganella dura]
MHSGPRHRARRTAGLARACGAALLATGWLGAHAQPPQAGAATTAPREFAVAAGTAPAPALPALALPSPHGGAARAIGDDRLAELRGGTDTPWSDMKLGGTVGNNAATNVVTGANIITDGAFSNASGLPMVIQNSGANVLIQNATIVNLQMR